MPYGRAEAGELSRSEICLGTMTWGGRNSEVLPHEPLEFVRSRWFTASTMIGATNMAQLEEDLNHADTTLDEVALAGIEDIHLRYPNPAW